RGESQGRGEENRAQSSLLHHSSPASPARPRLAVCPDARELDARRCQRFPRGRRKFAKALHDRVGDAAATRILEGKHVFEDRADLRLERGAQLAAGAVQPRLHGFGKNAQHRRGFLDAHLLDRARQQDEAELLGQAVDRFFEEAADLALRQRPLGIGVRAVLRQLHRFGARNSALADCVPIDGWAAPAQPRQRLVDDDARQPGADARLAAKSAQLRECLEIGVLKRVLGLGIVAQNAARDAIEAAIVPLDDGADRLLLARAGASDKVALGKGFVVDRHGAAQYARGGRRCGRFYRRGFARAPAARNPAAARKLTIEVRWRGGGAMMYVLALELERPFENSVDRFELLPRLWLVEAALGAAQIRIGLGPLLGPKDRLVVIKTAHEAVA